MTVRGAGPVGGVLLLLLTGCSGGSPTPAAGSASPTPVVTTAAVTVTPTATPTTTPTVAPPSPTPKVTVSPSAVPKAGSTEFGYVTAVLSSKQPVRLSFDRALFLTGEEANQAAAAHGDEVPVPNDYYIVNDNTLLRTITLASTVKVFGSLSLNSYAGEEQVEARPRTVVQLLGFVGTAVGRQTGFHLVYGEGGVVVRVEEQYQP